MTATKFPVLYRTYTRKKEDNTRESELEQKERTLRGFFELSNNLLPCEVDLVEKYVLDDKTMMSGRSMWIGGTEWSKKPENYYGSYNCNSLHVTSIDDFALNFDFLMQGCGVGTVLEDRYISQLPTVVNTLEVVILKEPSSEHKSEVEDSFYTLKFIDPFTIEATLIVGDTRQGWVKAYRSLFELAMNASYQGSHITVKVDLSNVRVKGTPIKGFGGVSNPSYLSKLFINTARILTEAVGLKLNSVQCSILLCEAGACAVAGNVRRSARLNQGASDDKAFAESKDNLWVNDNGEWKIDLKRDALRMANHTRVYHTTPTYQELVEAVRKQYYSGEGAIQYAPEAIARCNADILQCGFEKEDFIKAYEEGWGGRFLRDFAKDIYDIDLSLEELEHRLTRYGANPCLRGDMRLLTIDGYKRFDELENTEPLIINASGEVAQSKVWCSGVKDVIELKLTNKQIIACTSDHVFQTTTGEFEAKDCKNRQLMPYLKVPEHEPRMRVLGFIQGDGVLSGLSKSKTKLDVCIGNRDEEIYALFSSAGISYESATKVKVVVSNLNSDLVALGFSQDALPTRVLPSSYKNWNLADKAAFLNGLYSANGSVVSTRITFKTTCKALTDELVETLSTDFDIESYVTTNKATIVKFSNGSYLCKESYDVNIQQYTSKLKFFNLINFSLSYKVDKLAKMLIDTTPAVRAIKEVGQDKVYDFTEPLTNWGVVEGFVAHNCFEILGRDFFCCLSEVHLNKLDPFNLQEQENAFKVGGLIVSAFLKQKFLVPKLEKSRELDPIVAVSFTGLFDFFVNLFGRPWLDWWQAGRPEVFELEQTEQLNKLIKDLTATSLFTQDSNTYILSHIYSRLDEGKKINYGYVFKQVERTYLGFWKSSVAGAVKSYYLRNRDIIPREPNRYTAVQPAGTKSLLTNASAGWHPPKAIYYIRRITFAAYDPVALACIDYGYNVVPSQSCKDEDGKLLNDPYDPRVHEWLIEIPNKVDWAEIAGEDIDPSRFSIEAQFDFWMNVQKEYTTHNSSSTLEIEEHEIDRLAFCIHNAILKGDGYVSTAILARFHANETFPRLPFEPITAAKYKELCAETEAKRKSEDFYQLLTQYDRVKNTDENVAGPMGCDSDFCVAKETKNTQEESMKKVLFEKV